METVGQEITSQKDHVLVTIYHGKSESFNWDVKLWSCSLWAMKMLGVFCYLLQEKGY